MLEKHFAGKTTKKRQNSDSSTPPAHTYHLHSTLNGETRRDPVPPDASFYRFERTRPPGEISCMWYSHREPWARSAQPPAQTDPHPGKKEKKTKLNNKQQKKTHSKEGGVP
jgi:hypothetical protein